MTEVTNAVPPTTLGSTEKQPAPVDKHVGEKIRARRKIMGFSQQQLASALDLTFQQVQKYERGSNRVSASKLYDIAKFLQVPVSYFFPAVSDLEEDIEPDTFTKFAAVGGLELAESYLGLDQTNQRAVTQLAKNLAKVIEPA
ncbi:putative HTH DNA binding protein [Caulobacter phage CcrBL9]|uniref:Putative HTH DNA binding protein n=1 Tax=Caulobacter phage CcrBL9 TaxID=2283270 RepID=A0A385EBJ4_9CAUD|nr:putative HTH DNA binding protein [Caulobacter phage CcrBL9]AXQ69261.1 putative HTH DNA binding protein [Caulobacter phage CcrBL9]